MSLTRFALALDFFLISLACYLGLAEKLRFEDLTKNKLLASWRIRSRHGNQQDRDAPLLAFSFRENLLGSDHKCKENPSDYRKTLYFNSLKKLEMLID